MLYWFRAFVHRCIVLITDNWLLSNPVTPVPEVTIVTAAPPASVQAATVNEEISVPKPNRKTRRKQTHDARYYERARRRFDKFVEPKGTKPVKRVVLPKTNHPIKAVVEKPAIEFVEDEGDFCCVDKHFSDRSTDVLYDGNEMLGQFNFRDTILDQLDKYFGYLERMQKHDHQSYKFYKEVGAQLLPYMACPDLIKDPTVRDEEGYKQEPPALTPWFLQTRPAFGCIAYGTSPEAEKIESGAYDEKHRKLLIPKFMYFTKYLSDGVPWSIQPVSRAGDIYKMTVFWDKIGHRNIKGGGVPEEFPIFVSADGHIEVLRTLETHMVPIYSKRYGTDRIPQRLWSIPRDFEVWAKLHQTNAAHMLAHLFCDLARSVEDAALSMVRVSVKNQRGRHALFSLDPHRMPYFFQDRDYDLTETGHRRRIFHLVAPHLRRDGTVVKMHFRGQREFSWAGYDVRITIPGLDHKMLEEIDMGVIDDSRRDRGERYYSEGETGRLLRSAIDGDMMSIDDLHFAKDVPAGFGIREN